MTKLLDALFFSEKRKNLVLFLRDEAKNLTEIKDSLDVKAPAIIPQIRILEEKKIIIQKGKEYFLTDIGQILADNYVYSLIDILDLVENNQQFFDTHDLSMIPKTLLKQLHKLKGCRVDLVDPQNMYEPHRLFIENLSTSKQINGVTPVFNPSYPDFFLQLAMQEKEVILILTPEVYQRTEAEYHNLIKKFHDLNNTQIYIHTGKLNVAMMVTDHYFSFTPFFKDGSYDSQRNLIGTESSAISWGTKFFNYLLNNSNKL